MLRPRIIPCLLVHNGGLVKTIKFKNGKYIGDPINSVRLFNEKEVDELIVLDIDASRRDKQPEFKLIANLAKECRMPICYGGGIRTADVVEKIIGLGVEKVAIGTAAVTSPTLISKAAARVGSQSVAVVIDVKCSALMREYEIVTCNGTWRTGLEPGEFAHRAQGLGAGEIIVNSVDADGEMKGYDLELVSRVRQSVSIPITVLGGGGSLGDIEQLFAKFGVIGAGAGSLFVFKGKYRAVLINYPNRKEKDALVRRALTFFKCECL